MSSAKRVHIPSALRHLKKNDPRFARHVRVLARPRIVHRGSAFLLLARAIVYQQVSGAAARPVFMRLRQLGGKNRFPSPDLLLNTSIRDLRRLGLSGQKASYMHNLSAAFRDRQVRPRQFPYLSDAEISDQLTQVKGVGQWTADMFLIFGLQRPDVLAVGDLGIRKGFERHFSLEDLPDPDLMAQLAEPWRPYRTVGCWYMWRLQES